jgi:hypothetical protein
MMWGHFDEPLTFVPSFLFFFSRCTVAEVPPAAFISWDFSFFFFHFSLAA